MKQTITLTCNDEQLSSYESAYLLALWHASQRSDAPADDLESARLTERIGREIISRWIEVEAKTGANLWNRQGSHPYTLPQARKAGLEQSIILAAKEVTKVYYEESGIGRPKSIAAVDRLDAALIALEKKEAAP